MVEMFDKCLGNHHHPSDRILLWPLERSSHLYRWERAIWTGAKVEAGRKRGDTAGMGMSIP